MKAELTQAYRRLIIVKIREGYGWEDCAAFLKEGGIEFDRASLRENYFAFAKHFEVTK